jgi:hypothetical protein
MTLKSKKNDIQLVENVTYEKLIKEMLDIIKEKSNDRDSSIKDSIIQSLNKFEDKNENK